VVTRQAAAAVFAAGAVLAFCTGCNKTAQGTAASTTTDKQAATATLWDPCTQIDSDILHELGVDQSSRQTGIGGVQQPGWKDCSWGYPPEHDQSLTIWSTIYTVADFKKKTDNTEFTQISAAGRDGWKFHRVTDKDNEDCDLLFPGSSGTVTYQISFSNVEPGLSTSPCDAAMKVASIVAPLFPR
jgi:hypothetical protein